MAQTYLLTREVLPAWLRDKPLVAAMGLFDGVHLAHQALLAAAAKAAADMRGVLLVYTFDKNPLDVLTPQRAPKTLMPLSARIKAIHPAVSNGGGNDSGTAALFIRQFSILFAQLQPERFIRSFTDTFSPSDIFVGYNYTFGADGRGDVPMLRELGGKLGFSLSEMLAVKFAGEPISSTRIRREITGGNIELANAMLGRTFRVYGTLHDGGAFVPRGNHLLPGDGTYSISDYLISNEARQEKRMVIHKGKVKLTGMKDKGYMSVGVTRKIS